MLQAVNGKLTVIGLGYIGLPTAVVFAKNGWDVTGVDVTPRVVDLINEGKLPFVEEGLETALSEVVAAGNLSAQLTTPASEIYIVSVPTPFKGDHEADLSYIDAAADGIAPQLTGGELIVLESTSPPRTTAHMADRILRTRPDLSLDGSDGRPAVHFAHAPERVLPGRIMIEMIENDRIIGGLTPEAGERAREVYATFCEGELSLTDAKTAELAKLVENSYRDVNIAFANELSLIADRLGVDVWELIELANRHPRVNILQPGPGVGGHCIAVDPWFIVEADRSNSNLIRTAREVNDGKPDWVADKVKVALDELQPGAKVALLGLAFKPNIDDLRESPALNLAESLVAENPTVDFLVVEPNIGQLPDALEQAANAQKRDAEEAVAEASVVVLLVDHTPFKSIDRSLLDGKTVVDTRGLWR